MARVFFESRTSPIFIVPDAVLACLSNHRDLGMHTEMFSDGIMELVQKGIVNGSKKTLHKGKIVASFMMGTKELYDWANHNDVVEMHPSAYTNDPYIISRNDGMVALPLTRS